MKRLARLVAVAVALCAALAIASSARAYMITVNNAPLLTDSTFNSGIDLNGTFGMTGRGSVYDSKKKAITSFKVVGTGVNGDPSAPGNPTSPISLFDSTPISSTPVVRNLGADYTFTDPTLRTLANIEDLDIDLLNGHSGNFAINTLDIYTNSTVALIKDITIDLGGDLSALTFSQTGAATLTSTGFGTGTFSILGDLNATLTNLTVVAIGGLIPLQVADQTLDMPFALTGNYTVTGFGDLTRLRLGGSAGLSVPLSLSSALETSISDVVQLTISTTIDLMASLNVSMDYYLDIPLYPEPGSVVLLGIGLLALVPVIRRRRGVSRHR